MTNTSPQHGFTLLELLVSLTIVSIISALAIPQYREFKARAFDTRAQNDLRIVALAEEVYFLDNERYLSCENRGCEGLPGITKLSDGVTVSVNASESEFTARASHPKGSGANFTWLSAEGGLRSGSS